MTRTARLMIACLLLAGCPSKPTPPPPRPAPPPAINIGLNLDGLAYWSRYVPYVDITRQMCANDNVSCWDLDAGVTVDENGYPKGHAQSVTWAPVPSGSYDVSWDGAGMVSFPGKPFTLGPTSGSHHTGTLQVEPGQQIIVDVVPPVTNLHILVPASEYDPKHTFRREFLRRIGPFTTLRFMDLMNTNTSTVSNWADRTWPTAFSHASARGIAYEDIVDLAIESKKDVWVNIPTLATDDFVCRLARLLRYGESGERSGAPCDPSAPGAVPTGSRGGIPSDQRIYIEYSNEVWNWGFRAPETLYCMANGTLPPGHTGACPATRPTMAAIQPLVGSSEVPWSDNDYARAWELQALTTRHLREVFQKVFSDRTWQVQTVLGIQAAWPDGTGECMLSFLKRAFGSASGSVDLLGVAPYLDLDRGDDVDGLTLDGVFAGLDRAMNGTLRSWLVADKALSTRYGVPVVAYEGGQGLAGAHMEVKTQAQNDPRMYGIYQRNFALWNEVLGPTTLINHYAYANGCGGSGCWGLLASETDRGSQKWDALMSLLRSAGDADLNGVVNDEDCARAKANLHKSGVWWDHGDFNHDGVVGEDDVVVACKTSE